MYCNYKETTSSYSVITECNLPHSLPKVGIIFKMFVWNFEEAYDVCKILKVIRLTNTSKFLHNVITVKHSNYNVVTITLR